MTLKSKAELDEIDWELLRALQENARVSFKELGNKVNLTSSAVGQRVRRMEKLGIITGYQAIVNSKKVGFPIHAFIRVTAQGVNIGRLEEFSRNSPEVLECHKVTGLESFILKVGVSSCAHLERLIEALRKYSDTVTSIVLSSPVERRIVGKGNQGDEQDIS